jgi:hypothetical protein
MAKSRFDRLADVLAKKPGVYNPRGLAAVIGRKKLGAAEFNRRVRAGHRRAR